MEQIYNYLTYIAKADFGRATGGKEGIGGVIYRHKTAGRGKTPERRKRRIYFLILDLPFHRG